MVKPSEAIKFSLVSFRIVQQSQTSLSVKKAGPVRFGIWVAGARKPVTILFHSMLLYAIW